MVNHTMSAAKAGRLLSDILKRVHNEKQSNDLTKLFKNFPHLNPEDRKAFKTEIAEIRPSLKTENNLLIAATALSHGYALLTTNYKEFRNVSGLKYLNMKSSQLL